jgi:hypothetical protein
MVLILQQATDSPRLLQQATDSTHLGGGHPRMADNCNGPVRAAGQGGQWERDKTTVRGKTTDLTYLPSLALSQTAALVVPQKHTQSLSLSLSLSLSFFHRNPLLVDGHNDVLLALQIDALGPLFDRREQIPLCVGAGNAGKSREEMKRDWTVEGRT